MTCELCETTGGILLWQDPRCRIVEVDTTDYPGFCRVIWNDHVREMTDLDSADRTYFMQIIFAVEQALREVLRPEKINLASLGNQVAHLHWHVIPRFRDDPHFPQPVWGERQRAANSNPERPAWSAALRATIKNINKNN